MKVTILNWRDLSHPLAGGAEVLIDHLSRGLVERGHQVTLLCGNPVTQHPYQVFGTGGTYSQYLRTPAVYALHSRQSDLIIDTENGIPFFSLLWSRKPIICLVLHVHLDQWQDRFPRPIASIAARFERWALGTLYKKKMFVAISPSTFHALSELRIAPENIRLIEPCVDIHIQAAFDKSLTPLFITLSRLVPHKRIALIIQAWKQVQPKIGGRLVIIGDGPLLKELELMAEEIPGVEFVGKVNEPDKVELLSRAWFIVHAAHHEGWGISVMEAAACATPALVLDAPGVRDCVLDNETGIIVSHENSFESNERNILTAKSTESYLIDRLSKEWIDLASNPGKRVVMGESAFNRSKSFSSSNFLDSWENLILEVKNSKTDGQKQQISTEATSGIRRSLTLFKGFRNQFADPYAFYTLLAKDTALLIERYEDLNSRRILDVGGGSGYFAKAFAQGGAKSVFVEPIWEEMGEQGRGLGVGILADGLNLPFCDSSFDITHSSNVIEHVQDPAKFFEELIRVVRPEGIVFLAFTNWLSPFGGHETSPWHYIGGERAVRRYQKRTGQLPKNRLGESLFKLSISEVLKLARERKDVELIDVFPRYYPRWTKPLTLLPGIREVATWNVALVLRKRI